MSYDYDLFVIGGGSGGVRAARMAAQSGTKVGLAEEYRMGGTCVIRGCVPKKLMVYASSYAESFEDAKGYGWSVGKTSFDWPKLIAAKDQEIARLEHIYDKNLTEAGVEVYKTRAALKDAHTVVLAIGETISAKYILIATGGTPFMPDVDGIECAINSNDIFHLDQQPKRFLIVGGGYIACEFACIMNGLGSKVTQFYRKDRILGNFDHDICTLVAEDMQAKGIDLHVNTDVKALKKTQSGIEVTVSDGSVLIVDQVMYATGRVPNTKDLGLENTDVKMGAKREILVDEYSQTNVPNIYAVGDVTDRMQLTPVAIREGAAFVETVFNNTPTRPDHMLVPTAVFTQPEIGTVGMSEQEANKNTDIDIYRAVFRPMAHILAGKSERMLMKLIVHKTNRKVLGCHIVGHAAGEMIQMAAIAIKMGATKEDFDRTVAVHPTAAEELVTMKFPISA